MNWYIDSTRTDGKYLDIVNRTVEPCMEYFCNRISEIEDVELNDILKTFKDILEELPFLTLVTKKDLVDDFYIRYNSTTFIRFIDPLKSIRRDIILNKILA
jgi:hypothetical protein